MCVKKAIRISQHWHTEFPVLKLSSNKFEVQDVVVESSITGDLKPSKVSRYYNSYMEANQIVFFIESNEDFIIETKFRIKK